MKALKIVHRIWRKRSLWSLLLLLAVSCEDSYLKEPVQSDPISFSDEKAVLLDDMLNSIDLESGIVIVEKDGSIQEAVNVASPGDVIYIEPGIYKEAFSITKPGLKLIGLSSSEEDPVIMENSGKAENSISTIPKGITLEIVNIQLRNFDAGSTPISSLKHVPSVKRRLLQKMTREELGNGIAHYQFEIRVGWRPFDVVRLHRVVREHFPYHPVWTKGDIFMVHGSIQDFDDIFLTAGAENITVQTSSPMYLASKDIDVWGIDLAWTMVPVETTDFTFMKDWGVERDIDHTLRAMTIARLIRGFTSHNFCKLNLLGFSYSAHLAYGAAGRESQRHPVLRHIKGLIPVDEPMKYAPVDEEFRLNACNAAAAGKAQLDKGNYVNDGGQMFGFLGNLALTAPDEPSPIPDFAPMTNLQVMLFMGSMTYKTGGAPAPYWHFLGGDLEGFYYSDIDRWLRLAVSLAPYQPRRSLYETNVCLCDEGDVSFDDYLGDITLPIFYLGAGGALGSLGEYSTSLTASTDVTHYIVSIPGTEPEADYGHADLFMAKDADVLVWAVLYDWLVAHSSLGK